MNAKSYYIRMGKMGKVSLILPIYNEQVLLEEVLWKYIADLDNITAKYQMPWEIIAVDDASMDSSKLILIDFAKKYHNFKVVSLADRSGKQAAVSAGFAVATGSIVLTAEIDIQNPMGLLENLVKEHLESKVPIIYGYQQFTGWKRRKALFTDRLTRFACALFMIDGYFTGIVNAELYAADVVDTLRAYPEKNKYMRSMNNWVGWESKEYWYAREYDDQEAKAKKEQLRKRSRHYQGFKNHGHVNSTSLWWGWLCLFLTVAGFTLTSIFGTQLSVVALWVYYTISAALLVLSILFFLRAALLKRVGKIHYREGEVIYQIKSILNK